MRKIIFICFIFLCFLVPNNVSAMINIGATSLKTSTTESEVGGEFVVRYSFNILDNIVYTDGVFMVKADLIYDENVLSPVAYDSNIVDTVIGTDKNTKKTVFLSVIGEDDDASNRCKNSYLFCGSQYYIDIKFFIKTTKETYTNVTVDNVIVYNTDYTSDLESLEFDQLTQTGIVGGKVTVNIKNNNVVVEEPKSVLKDSITTNSSFSSNNQVSKSNNKFLKSLEIEGYDISFDKFKYNYDISVEKDVNSLKVKAELENKNAKYVITGADDIKKNDDKIVISVTAENGEKNIYTIYVRKKGESLEQSQNNQDEFKAAKIHIDKKYIKIASIVGGVIFGIIIIVFIVTKINDRKLDKLVKKM